MSASQPPEALTSGRCHSPPRAPSLASHSADPVACPPPMSDCSTADTWCDWKALGMSQSTPLPGFPSPIPTIPGLDHSKRPTSTTVGLVHSRKMTSTNPRLGPSGRPINHPGLVHMRRPTPAIPGLGCSSRPTSGPSRYQGAAKTWCHCNSSHGDSLLKDLSLTIQEASFWTGPTYRQIEAGWGALFHQP